MATAKWATPSAESSNLAGTTLDGLSAAAGSNTTTAITYDNSTNLDLYAGVRVALGSITPTTGGSITLTVAPVQNSVVPDFVAGAGDVYTMPLTTTASAKAVMFPLVRLYPKSLRLYITNNAGVAFAASGNAIYVQPHNEAVA